MEIILDLYGYFLLNEGLLNWEIVVPDLTGITITSCKTIIIITKNQKTYKRILEENGFQHRSKLKTIESCALYLERKNYDISEYTIDILIKDLEQFGIYKSTNKI